MPRISVVTSLYGSAPYIQELYDRTVGSVRACGAEYEFVFVDDGSPDDSGAIVKGLIEGDKNVRLIELSRNFGQHRALMTGLEVAKGDYVFLIDSDLEEEPELLEKFYGILAEDSEIDVVYGVMEQRKGGFMERVPGALFYKLMNAVSEIPIPENVLGARLMRADYVKGLIQFQEARPFLGGLMAMTGFKQVAVPCQKASKGSTSYNLRRKVNLALDALISYSTCPLGLVAGLGMVVTIVSILAGVWLLVRGQTSDAPTEGWMLVLVSIWLVGGLIITSLGIVGVYVGRVFGQVKQRPNTVIRRIYN